MKRKALALILAIAMAFALAACGSSGRKAAPAVDLLEVTLPPTSHPASMVGVINCSTGVLAAMGEGTPLDRRLFHRLHQQYAWRNLL